MSENALEEFTRQIISGKLAETEEKRRGKKRGKRRGKRQKEGTLEVPRLTAFRLEGKPGFRRPSQTIEGKSDVPAITTHKGSRRMARPPQVKGE